MSQHYYKRKKNKSTLINKQSTKSKHQKTTGQVRIIGGRYKRQLIPFIEAQGLRPSPDRLRETLFNWLQFDLHDANVLDVCAGSGVLGFEALSRGAKYTTFIELQPKQATLIKQTAEKLKLDNHSFDVITGDAVTNITKLKLLFPSQNLNSNPLNSDELSTEVANPIYHFVFLDPPYDLNLWIPIIYELVENKLVNSHTIFYIEDKRNIKETLKTLPYPYQLIKQVKMGQINAQLVQFNFCNP